MKYSILGPLLLLTLSMTACSSQFPGSSNSSSLERLNSLQASDLNKQLVTGARAELMALNMQQASSNAIEADLLSQYGSASLLIDDPSGNPAGYLILMGPQVEGDLWSALSKVDSLTGKEKGYFSAFVSAQPMFSGVVWTEQGVQGLTRMAISIERLKSSGTLQNLIVLDNASVAGKLNNGQVVRLNSTLTVVSNEEVQRDITARNSYKNQKSDVSELQKVNATWAAWSRSYDALQKLGGVRETLQANALTPTLGRAVNSHLNFGVLVQGMASWNSTQKVPVSLGGKSLITVQSIPGRTNNETGSASCGWFGICAYQYDSHMDYWEAHEFAGGAVQLPLDYDALNPAVTISTRYRGQDLYNPFTSSDSLQGCSAAALISMADWYWRRLGVKWYGYELTYGHKAIYDYSMRPYYGGTYSWMYPGRRFENQYPNTTYANHPGVRLGRKMSSNNRSEAMDLMQIRADSGSGSNVTSNTNGGMYNFLAGQKATSQNLGPLGLSLQMHGGYNDFAANIINGGSMAGILREAYGWQSLPVLVMYPSPQGGGHTSLVLNYSVYYPVVGNIQIRVITVDHPDVNIELGSTFSTGLWSWY